MKQPWRIVVSMPALPPAALALLHEHDVFYADPAAHSADALRAAVAFHNPHALLVRVGQIDARMLDSAPSLRVVSKHGSGTDSIDVGYAKSLGIVVRSTPGANAVSVAEHTMALMLACAKSLPRLNALMHGGTWTKAEHEGLQMSGRTLGIIGLGSIGQRVAGIAHAFGMNVIAHVARHAQLPCHVRTVSLDDIWRLSDFISLHCPLTVDTMHIVNAAALARCRHGVVVINTGRGGLIDDVAFVSALRNGQVGAAGLDTFTVEPAGADNPYCGLDNVVMTPHVGAATRDAFEAAALQATRNMLESLLLQE